MFGAVTFVPIYLQISKGISPTVSGLQLLPMMFGILTASTISGQIITRTGRYRALPIVGLALMIVGLGLLSTLTTETSDLVIGFYIAILGLGMGPLMPVLTTAVQNAAPREMLGAATASGVMFRQVGGSLGVALFGALFASLLAASLPALPGGGDLTGEISPQMLNRLPPELQDAVTSGVVAALHPVFQIAAIVSAIGLVFALFLKEIPLRSRATPVRSEAGTEATPPAAGTPPRLAEAAE